MPPPVTWAVTRGGDAGGLSSRRRRGPRRRGYAPYAAQKRAELWARRPRACKLDHPRLVAVGFCNALPGVFRRRVAPELYCDGCCLEGGLNHREERLWPGPSSSPLLRVWSRG